MKQKVPMICNIVSLILLIVFVIKSIVDYTQYSILNIAKLCAFLFVGVSKCFVFGNSCNYFVRYWFRCKEETVNNSILYGYGGTYGKTGGRAGRAPTG